VHPPVLFLRYAPGTYGRAVALWRRWSRHGGEVAPRFLVQASPLSPGTWSDQPAWSRSTDPKGPQGRPPARSGPTEGRNGREDAPAEAGAKNKESGF